MIDKPFRKAFDLAHKLVANMPKWKQTSLQVTAMSKNPEPLPYNKKQHYLNRGYKEIKSDKQAYQLIRWSLKQKRKDYQRGTDPAYTNRTEHILLVKPGNLYMFHKIPIIERKILLICDLSQENERKA